MDENALEVVREAQQIVWAAGWHLQERMALDRLAGIAGLARARLEPCSEVIQLVAYDGEHLGHVRRESPPETEQRWVAVQKDRARQVGTYPRAAAAAAALARAYGRLVEGAS